jgi:hypothetical protein
MFPVEIARILKGSLNRGDKGSYLLYPNYNADLNINNQQLLLFNLDDISSPNSPFRLDNKGIVPFSAQSGGYSNFPIQNEYLWPWSHASLLFLLIVSRLKSNLNHTSKFHRLCRLKNRQLQLAALAYYLASGEHIHPLLHFSYCHF